MHTPTNNTPCKQNMHIITCLPNTCKCTNLGATCGAPTEALVEASEAAEDIVRKSEKSGVSSCSPREKIRFRQISTARGKRGNGRGSSHNNYKCPQLQTHNHARMDLTHLNVAKGMLGHEAGDVFTARGGTAKLARVSVFAGDCHGVSDINIWC